MSTISLPDENRWLTACLVLAAVLICIRAYVTTDFRLFDDAYITYRYAANLAEGRGLVYNPGEYVLGTTTPGYAVLLGGGAALFGTDAIPLLSRIVNLICTLATAGAVGYITYRAFPVLPIAGGAASLILMNSTFLYSGLAGMEVPLFLMLVSLGFAALVSSRYIIAALILGLLPWVRPEGIFVIGLAGIHFLICWRLFGLKKLFLLLLPGALLGVVLMTTYGTFIPQSVVAKNAGLYPMSIGYTLEDIGEHLGQSFLVIGITGAMAEGFFGLGKIAMTWGWLIVITAVGMFVLARRIFALWMIPALGFIMALFFGISRTLIFDHYYALYEPVMMLCWWLTLAVVFIYGRRWYVRWMADHDVDEQRLRAAAIGFAFGIVAAFQFVGSISSLYEQPEANRLIVYHDLAVALKPVLPVGIEIAMPEIGELGFTLEETTILDTAGLITPAAVDYFPLDLSLRLTAEHGSVPPQYIKDTTPEMLITMDIFIYSGLYDDPWFWEHYQEVIRICGNWMPWGSRCVWVYARNDLVEQVDWQAIRSQFVRYEL